MAFGAYTSTSRLLTMSDVLSLLVSEMHSILRQPVRRMRENKPSGSDAHFEHIDAYMVE